MPKAVQKRDRSARALQAALLAWYAQHKRDLPWRRDRDPYRVWVSEIMLQQTRVAAVLEHYRSFLEAFPTVQALAHAPQERVLARWSGLGYYRRARMLHEAASVIVKQFGGVIPRSAEQLRTLPGIGRYSAAAVASIAFDEPVAVVDGNVQRVLSRLDGEPCSQTSAWRRAQELIEPKQPGDWNQAMMELGATVCTPLGPQCRICPVRAWCRAPGADVSRPKAVRKRLRSSRNLIERNHCVYLVQRPADAAKMAGMWELPECAIPDLAEAPSGAQAVFRHSITDTDYEVQLVRTGVRALSAEQKRVGRWVKREDLFTLPLTGLTRKILRKMSGTMNAKT